MKQTARTLIRVHTSVQAFCEDVVNVICERSHLFYIEESLLFVCFFGEL